ncbi:MAG TPA: hypothetical protein QGF95_14335, partial [Candidatus Latescibacteria bacterium]|nr:hypothetical protein [Candidatus Latescibacterota bacterium]
AKFFYWQCFQEEGNYEPGVMTYPFACGAYQVPAEQVSIFFKYMHAVRTAVDPVTWSHVKHTRSRQGSDPAQ